MINVDLSGIRNIQNRIAALQERFGIEGGVPGMDFSETLQREMQKSMSQASKAKMPDAVEAADKAASAQATVREVQIAAMSPASSTIYGDKAILADASLSQLVQEAAAKYNVDPKLVSAVAEVESGGNQLAESAAGAIGVMQLMPDTAASLGVNPYDERQNVEGGAKYLRQMLDTFGGNVEKAIAAYNAGPRAVQEYGGVPPYRETEDYVDKVLDIYR